MSPGFRRAAALALLGLVLALAWRIAALPAWRAFEDDRSAIAAQRAAIARFSAIAARRQAYADALLEEERDPALAGALIESPSDTLAGATLQQRVKEIIERAGGSLVSSQSMEPEAAGPFRKVRLNVRLLASTVGLQRVLHTLESERPMVVVEEVLALARGGRAGRSTRPGASDGQLDVRLVVAAFVDTRSGRGPQRSGG